MALTDLFNIVHDMSLFGQNVLNVYQVERANAGEQSANIADAFQFSILPDVRAAQSASVIHNELRIFNLGTSTDFGTFTLGAAVGLRAGTRLQSFSSGGIKFPSRDRALRSGFKRYCGMLETDDVDNALSAAYIALLDTLGGVIVGNWLASADSHHVCNYIIVKRVCIITPPVGDPCPQYRLPETGDPLVTSTPNQSITQLNTRSQVSRRVAPS